MIAIFTDSSFALFSATRILKNSGQKAALFTTKDNFLHRLRNTPSFSCIRKIDKWPKGILRYSPKNYKKKQAQEQIIEVLSHYSPSEIWFHEIYSEQWNWIAFTYKKQSPNCIIRLLPDGFLNTARQPLSKSKKRNQKIKSILSKSYTPFDGDWIGINSQYNDNDLIENIYLPENFPHEYKENKVQYFPLTIKRVQSNSSKAILVEQSLLDRGYLNQKQLQSIYSKLEKDWKKKGITEIYIAPHPKAQKRDFSFSDLPVLNSKAPFLEEEIIKGKFDYIYSCFSTIFFLSPSLNYTFISFGLDELKDFDKKESYYKLLQKLGVVFL